VFIRYYHLNQSLEGCRLHPVIITPHIMLALFLILTSRLIGHSDGYRVRGGQQVSVKRKETKLIDASAYFGEC
jgi:hypothetical protein